VQQYFLEYLLADEQKHEPILDKLHSTKDEMYPCGGINDFKWLAR
jgi:hypothetical protein